MRVISTTIAMRKWSGLFAKPLKLQKSQKIVTSIDKQNVLATSKFWRKVAGSRKDFPDVTLEHQLVDSAASYDYQSC